MLFRILETCLSIIAVILVLKELIIPMIMDKPLFPMIRKTIDEAHNKPSPTQPASSKTKRS